jgi:transcriptional regulator with XRE-family HTH domain
VVGEILRKRREELNLDLKKISETLKIKYDYLIAIEEGARERLPADVYVKGYIHEYAKILNLNPETILHSYTQNSTTLSPEQQVHPLPHQPPQKNSRAAYVIVPFLLLLALGVILWQFPASEPEKPHPTVIDTPPAEPKPAPAETPVEESVVHQEPAFHMLEIRADDTTWLLVMIDRTETREMLMQPGETLQLQAKKGFSLKIGNAAGVRLVFDGKDIGKLGEKGSVITLDLPHPQT